MLLVLSVVSVFSELMCSVVVCFLVGADCQCTCSVTCTVKTSARDNSLLVRPDHREGRNTRVLSLALEFLACFSEQVPVNSCLAVTAITVFGFRSVCGGAVLFHAHLLARSWLT